VNLVILANLANLVFFKNDKLTMLVNLVILVTLLFFVNLVILGNQVNTAFMVIIMNLVIFKKSCGRSLDSLNSATLVNQVIVVNLMFLIYLMNDRIGRILRML
jgi:hypothetical protein